MTDCAHAQSLGLGRGGSACAHAHAFDHGCGRGCGRDGIHDRARQVRESGHDVRMLINQIHLQ